jgi:hypothetical protein
VMGTTVIGGMMFASGIAIFIIPALFYGIEKISGAEAEQLKAKTSAGTPDLAPGD